MKKRLNCLLFAFFLWINNRLRTGIGIKRSVGLKGLIPHFFHIKEKDKLLIVEDYIPRKRKNRITDNGESFVLFDGLYRVRIYRLEATSTNDTLFGARREALLKTKRGECV